MELISHQEINEGRTDTPYHTMVSGTTFNLINVHKLGGATVWDVEGLTRGQEQKLARFTVHYGNQPMTDFQHTVKTVIHEEPRNFEGFDGECEIKVDVQCETFKKAYEKVSKIARLRHCEFPILSRNEIKIRPGCSENIV